MSAGRPGHSPEPEVGAVPGREALEGMNAQLEVTVAARVGRPCAVLFLDMVL